MTKNILRDLEDEEFFVNFVRTHYESTGDYGNLLSCTVTVDEDRVKWAHKEYQQGVDEFKIRLDSGDPDHYKRCGALLRALYRIKPIVAVDFTPELEEFDTLLTPLGVSHSESEYALSMGRTFSEFHNELTAFALAYNVCAMYENKPSEINADYIHTMCVYLASNDNLSGDSLYMIFKSLMLE